MEKDYKVEMKPTYWEVILSSGMYSDYRETHLFFAGNDEFEIWDFLKRYIDDVAKEDDYNWGVSDEYALVVKWNKEIYISKKYTGDKDTTNMCNIADVDISRLNIIYFNK